MLITPTPSRDEVVLEDFDPALDAKIENASRRFDLTSERKIEPYSTLHFDRS